MQKLYSVAEKMVKTVYISFSPPDITEREIREVAKAMRSGEIVTMFRTVLAVLGKDYR